MSAVTREITVPCHEFQRRFGWSDADQLPADVDLHIYSDLSVRCVDPDDDNATEYRTLGTLSAREWSEVGKWIRAMEEDAK